MKIRNYIREELKTFLSENSNIPAGAEYIKDAPYNEKEPNKISSKTPSSNEFESVWYGKNAGLSILKDKNGNFYVFSYDMIDNEDFKPYADIEVVQDFHGYDEDGSADVDTEEFWELDGQVIENYVNDNLENLSRGEGMSDYESGEDLVLIDNQLKLYILDYANKYVKNNKESLLKIFKPENINEGKSDFGKEPFIKVVFNADLSNQSDRLSLMKTNREYFAEPLGKRGGESQWSTYVPKVMVDEYVADVSMFNPEVEGVEIMASRIKPLEKGLRDGEEITFLDYTVSQNNPPRKIGYLKPGFIQRNRSLLKWDNNSKEAWINNEYIDKYYFYHGDVSDIENHPNQRVDSKYAKIFFDDAVLSDMSFEQEDELRRLIKQYKGQLRYVFGKERASGGQRYTLIPNELADDFIQDAYDFGAYYGETEQNLKLENQPIHEVRKVIRTTLSKIVK